MNHRYKCADRLLGKVARSCVFFSLIGVTILCGPLATAYAQSDTTAPVLTNLVIETPVVDTTSGSDAVRVSITVTDDISGVGHPFVDVRSPSGQSRGSSCSMVGGTSLNAMYECTSNLPQFSEAGIWEVSVSLADLVGNSDTVSASELAALGFDSTFENGDNIQPTADAGLDQIVPVGADATLSGVLSSDDNTSTALLSFSWTIASAPQGSTAEIQNPTSSLPTLTPDMPGDYIVELRVTDLEGQSSEPDTVTIESEISPAFVFERIFSGGYDYTYFRNLDTNEYAYSSVSDQLYPSVAKEPAG